MAVSVDRDLKFVIPVQTTTGQIYVYSIPISTATFNLYYYPLGKTWSKITNDNVLDVAPRMASRMLRDISKATMRFDGTGNFWDGPDGIEGGLLNEIRRLTTVVRPNGRGWETVPLDDAHLDDEDERDVISIITFFTCFSASAPPRTVREEFLKRMAGYLDVQLVSSTPTAFAASLQTSTEIAPSGETVPI